MFRPDRMSLVQLLILREDVLRVTHDLVLQEVLHILDLKALYGESGRTFVEGKERADALDARIRCIDELLSGLVGEEREGLTRRRERPVRIDPQGLLEESEHPLAELAEKMEAIRQEQARIREQIEGLDTLAEQMYTLEELGLDVADMERFRYFYVGLGVMPRAYLDRLERHLQDYTRILHARPIRGDVLSVVVVAAKDVQKVVEHSLEAVKFRRVELSERLKGSVKEGAAGASKLDAIELEIWRLREEEAAVHARLSEMAEEWGERLQSWKSDMQATVHVLTSMEHFGATEYVCSITGFAPSSACKALSERIQMLTRGTCYVQISVPEEGVLSGPSIPVPTRFNNPRFLKPFERLVATYGYPSYGGIDPTPFVALTFLMMFGLMFGDVGQGLSLALIGLVLGFYPRFKGSGVASVGGLLLFAGMSATLFGFLFGSVFGVEHWLQPLWMRPTEHIMFFLRTTILLGIGILSLGIVLGIVQAMLRRQVCKALFGQWGLFSGIFYWGCLGLLGVSLRGGRVNGNLAAMMLIVPILFVMFGDLVVEVLSRRRGHEGRSEHGVDLVESVFKPIEMVMGYLTNTVSYVRVGAFGLNHAALCMAVYLIADSLSSREARLSVMIEGNIFVIALETLVVFIQCLRLEYYEFFSKFFAGDGVQFEPLSLRSA